LAGAFIRSARSQLTLSRMKRPCLRADNVEAADEPAADARSRRRQEDELVAAMDNPLTRRRLAAAMVRASGADASALCVEARTIAAVGGPWQARLPAALLASVMRWLVGPSTYRVALICCAWNLATRASGSAGLDCLDAALLPNAWQRMPPRVAVHVTMAQSVSIGDLVALHRMSPRIATLAIFISTHDRAPQDAVARFGDLTSLACTYKASPDTPGLSRLAELMPPVRLRVLAFRSGWTVPLQVAISSPTPVLEELRLYGSVMAAIRPESLRGVRRIAVWRDGAQSPPRIADLLRSCPSLEQLYGVEIGPELSMDVITSCTELRLLALDRVDDASPGWSRLSKLSALSTVSLPYDCVRLEALSYDAAGGGLTALATLPALKRLIFRLAGQALTAPARELVRLHTGYMQRHRPDLRVQILPHAISSIPAP
jgi:hypothetical protein